MHELFGFKAHVSIEDNHTFFKKINQLMNYLSIIIIFKDVTSGYLNEHLVSHHQISVECCELKNTNQIYNHFLRYKTK